MNPDEKKLIQDSWEKVLPIANDAGELFYNKLFELDPDLRPLFKGEMSEQINKLFTALNAAINGLDDLATLKPVLEGLGERHVDYGVQEKDYATVGEALIWTLQQGLGDAFTDEVKSAWLNMYTLVAEVMITAAKNKDAA